MPFGTEHCSCLGRIFIYLRLFRNARSAAPPARSPDTAPAIGVASPVFTALFGVPVDGFCVVD